MSGYRRNYGDEPNPVARAREAGKALLSWAEDRIADPPISEASVDQLREELERRLKQSEEESP